MSPHGHHRKTAFPLTVISQLVCVGGAMWGGRPRLQRASPRVREEACPGERSPPGLSRIAGRRLGEDRGRFRGLAYSDDGFGSRDSGGPQRHMRVARSGLESRVGARAIHLGANQRRA